MASAPLHLFARRAVNSLALTLTLNDIFMNTNCYSTTVFYVLAKVLYSLSIRTLFISFRIRPAIIVISRNTDIFVC